MSEDLDIKVYTEEGTLWKGILERAEKAILNSQAEIEINELIVKHAKKRVKRETVPVPNPLAG
tara:strand:+ start:2575 stop:2763 length:189 start_codon:yes stop_codon:yes gene_type:complete